MGPVSIGVEVQRNTDGDTPSSHFGVLPPQVVEPRSSGRVSLRKVAVRIPGIPNKGIKNGTSSYLLTLPLKGECKEY